MSRERLTSLLFGVAVMLLSISVIILLKVHDIQNERITAIQSSIEVLLTIEEKQHRIFVVLAENDTILMEYLGGMISY